MHSPTGYALAALALASLRPEEPSPVTRAPYMQARLGLSVPVPCVDSARNFLK